MTVGQVGAAAPDQEAASGSTCSSTTAASPKIPASTGATVANRSVVGEQYVDLVPPNGKGPFVRAGADDPDERATDPDRDADAAGRTSTGSSSRCRWTTCAPPSSELGNAVHGRGRRPRPRCSTPPTRCFDTASTPQNLHATIDLIDDVRPVLQTQLDQQRAAARAGRTASTCSPQQLKKSDPDIRHLLDTGPTDLATVRDFIKDNRTDLGVTLANLSTVGDLLVRHLDGIEQIFELYPALAAGGPTVLHDNAGLRSASSCRRHPTRRTAATRSQGREGYYGTVRREPGRRCPRIAPNVAARCTAPASGRTRRTSAARPTSPAATRSAPAAAASPTRGSSPRTRCASGRRSSASGTSATARGSALVTDALH